MDDRTAGLLLVLSCLIGIFIGIGISYLVGLHAIEVIGTSFQVQSMNVTVQLNQSMLLEAMQDSVNRSIAHNTSQIDGIDLADGLP